MIEANRFWFQGNGTMGGRFLQRRFPSTNTLSRARDVKGESTTITSFSGPMHSEIIQSWESFSRFLVLEY
jgi:hypothetical protein